MFVDMSSVCVSVCGSVCLYVTLLGDKRASLSDETVSSSAIYQDFWIGLDEIRSVCSKCEVLVAFCEFRWWSGKD
jgi:hypothetical protein